MDKAEPLCDLRFVKAEYRLARPADEAPENSFVISIHPLAGGPQSLFQRLKDASRTELIPEAPKPEAEENWLRWMMSGLCTVLCLEWLIRRLAKLA